jgi:hypothetical protein
MTLESFAPMCDLRICSDECGSVLSVAANREPSAGLFAPASPTRRRRIGGRPRSQTRAPRLGFALLAQSASGLRFARLAHWTTFALRAPVFALGAALRAHGPPYFPIAEAPCCTALTMF